MRVKRSGWQLSWMIWVIVVMWMSCVENDCGDGLHSGCGVLVLYAWSIVVGVVRHCIDTGVGDGFGLYGDSVDALNEIGDGSWADVGVASAILCCEELSVLSSSLQELSKTLVFASFQVGSSSGSLVLLAGVSAVLLSLPLELSLMTLLSSSLYNNILTILYLTVMWSVTHFFRV